MNFLECTLISIGIGCAFFIGAYVVGPNPNDYPDKQAKPIKLNVICIEGYEYIQNLITGYASGVVYTQSLINTDEGLRAKVCHDAGEQQ